MTDDCKIENLKNQALAFIETQKIASNTKWINEILMPLCERAFCLAEERGADSDTTFFVVLFSKMKKIVGYDDNSINLFYKYKDYFTIENEKKVVAILHNLHKDGKPSLERNCVYDAKFESNLQSVRRALIQKNHTGILSTLDSANYTTLLNQFEMCSEEFQSDYKITMESLKKIVGMRTVNNIENEKIKLKTFEVVAKCGHVGQNKYYPAHFVVSALNAADAAKTARLIPRVKHDHKDAILEVKEITPQQAKKLSLKNNKNPYMIASGKRERKRIAPMIERHLVDEPPEIIKKKDPPTPVFLKGKKIKNLKKYYTYNGNITENSKKITISDDEVQEILKNDNSNEKI